MKASGTSQINCNLGGLSMSVKDGAPLTLKCDFLCFLPDLTAIWNGMEWCVGKIQRSCPGKATARKGEPRTQETTHWFFPWCGKLYFPVIDPSYAIFFLPIKGKMKNNDWEMCLNDWVCQSYCFLPIGPKPFCKFNKLKNIKTFESPLKTPTENKGAE